MTTLKTHREKPPNGRNPGKPPAGAGRHSLLGLTVKTLPLVAVVVVLTVVALRFVGPPCPKRLVIATGSAEGAYYAYAQRYAEILARDGITLEVRQTAGSIENLALLRDGDSDVSVAIVQGGAEAPGDEQTCASLASLYLEPVWIFYRGDSGLDQLADLRGATVAVGPEGSGTRALAIKLLESNGLLDGRSGEAHVRTVPLSGQQAAGALRAGRVHAAVFVVAPTSPIVRELLAADGIELMSVRRAEAYPPEFPYLSKATLHEGVLDLRANVPGRDVDLLAANASLVARKDIHSALVPLLLEAVREVHRPGGPLHEPDAYPSPRGVCLPLDADAARYFKSGPSFLYRVLPFRIAAWLDRMKILLLPLCTLLLPLLKVLPPLYRWRIRSKIYRWYRILRDVETRLRHADDESDFSDDVRILEKLDLELCDVSVPLSYMEEFYNLRLHVSFMRRRLEERSTRHEPALARAA